MKFTALIVELFPILSRSNRAEMKWWDMHYTELRNIRLEDGRTRYVLLRNQDGILAPQYYPNLFILAKHNGSPQNTIKQVLMAIRCLMAWADRENIDIVGRMRSFLFLTEHELTNLKDALLLNYDRLAYEATRAIARCDPKISGGNVVEMPTRGVGSSTANIRLEYIGKYLNWLVQNKRNWLTKTEKEEIEPDFKRQSRWFKNNFLTVVESLPGKPLTKNQKEILEEVLKADSSITVWDEKVRCRNRLIVRLYWETGVRKAELMCFKLEDAPGDRTITLRKIPNDPEDPRKDKGKVKTRSRTLNISAALDQVIQDYILEHRQSGRKRIRHKFIFTSASGSPISVSAIDNIFAKLKKVEGLQNISPHDLRHDFATDLRRRLSVEGHKDEVAEDYMRSVLGWSPKSKMPAYYTQQLAAEIICLMSQERQERLDK